MPESSPSRTDRPRPRVVLVVAGTDTEVGKTWTAARLVEHLRSLGMRLAARKPVQSFEPGERTDAEVLAQASGEPSTDVCPDHRRFAMALAPPTAARELDAPSFTIADLADEVAGSWPPERADIGVVELAGGPRSPMASDGDGVDLTAAIDPDAVLLVAHAGLGTISAVRLSSDALGAHRLVVFLNRFDERSVVHRTNRATLVADGYDVRTTIDEHLIAGGDSLPR